MACLLLHYEIDRLTKTALGDLMLQDYLEDDMAVYVVDNGSAKPFVLDPEMAKKGVVVLRSEENRFITGGFNWAIRQLAEQSRFEFFWLITNDVRIPNRHTLSQLIADMATYQHCGVIQATMPSNHSFLKAGSGRCVGVPFCEWTAPLMRYAALVEVGYPDERLRFIGMDVDWCYLAAQSDWRSMVDRTVRMAHPYEQTWEERLELTSHYYRRMLDTALIMQEKWGRDWYSIMVPEQVRMWDKFYADNKLG